MKTQDQSAIATTTTQAPVRLLKDVTIVHHLDVLGPTDSEAMPFWFGDAETLILDLERRLGFTNGAEVVAKINELGFDVVHGTSARDDESRLVFAQSEEDLERLMSSPPFVDEGAMSTDDAFAYVLSGRVGYAEQPRKDRSFGSRDFRRSSFPARRPARVASR